MQFEGKSERIILHRHYAHDAGPWAAAPRRGACHIMVAQNAKYGVTDFQVSGTNFVSRTKTIESIEPKRVARSFSFWHIINVVVQTE
jgi:hypothetical protein